MLFFPLLFSLISLLQTTLAGHIDVIDYNVDYGYLALARNLQFTFSLENDLPNDAYLKIRLPFSIDTGSVGMRAWWVYYQRSNCSFAFPLQRNYCTITKSVLAEDAGLNAYWVQFRDINNTAAVTLNKTTQITLLLRASVPITSVTAPPTPVEILTATSNLADYIVLDRNPVAALLDLLPTPVPSTTLFLPQTSLTVACSSEVQFQFNLATSVTKAQRIVVEVDNDDFAFFNLTTNCTSTTLASDKYKCTQITWDKILIETVDFLTPGQTEIFSIWLRNPQFVQTSIISAYILNTGSSQILDYQQNLNLKTSAVLLTNMGINLAWGLDLVSTSTGNLFGIYRNSASRIVYNSLKFSFGTSSILQQSLKYLVVLKLGSDAHALPNSLKYNLADFSNTQRVLCDYTDSNYNVLQCSNVGFTTNGPFSISLKVTLDAGGASLNADFGKISIFPWNNVTKTYYSTSEVVESRASLTNINVRTNINLVSSSTDYLGVSTKSLQTNILSSEGFGIQYTGTTTTDQALEFSLLSTTALYGGSYTNPSGIDIYTSAAFINPQPGYTYVSSDCYHRTISTAGLISTCKVSTSTKLGASTTNLKYAMSASHSSIIATATATPTEFGFDQINVLKFTQSLYADLDETIDFYIGLIGTTSLTVATSDATANYNTRSLVNSFVLPTGQMSNMIVTISNFWTDSAGTNNINGNEFPAFIRIFGYLGTNERTAAKKMVVFFDQLDSFPEIDYDVNDLSYKRQAACAGIDKAAYCEQAPGNQNLMHFPWTERIQFTYYFDGVTSSSFMHMIVPVATVPNQINIRVRLGILDANDILQYISKQFPFSFSLIPGIINLQNLNNGGYIDLQGYNYMVNSASKVVGGVSDTFFKVYHTDAASTWSQNSGLNEGAAFVYVGKWNFWANDFVVTPNVIIQGANEYQKCRVFSYLYVADTFIPQRYGMFCPVYGNIDKVNDGSTNIQVKKFVFPYTNGVRMPNAYSTISDKSGKLMKYRIDDTLENLVPNNIIVQYQNVSIDLPVAQKSLRVGFIFTTTNQLQKTFLFKVSSPVKLNFYPEPLLKCRFYKVVFDTTTNLTSYVEVPTTTCTQEFFGFYALSKVVVSSTLPPAEYKMEFNGVNVIREPVTYQDIYIETQSIEGRTIDKLQVPFKVYYSFEQNVMELTINNVTFSNTHKLSQGILSVVFRVRGRSIFDDEMIAIDLDLLQQNNQDLTKLDCTVRNVTTLLFANDWATCSLSPNLKQIILKPQRLIQVKTTKDYVQYQVDIGHIRTAESLVEYTVKVSLLNPLSNEILSQTEAKQLPRRVEKIVMDYTQLVLQGKSFNTIGSLSSIQFTIQSVKQDIIGSSIVYVYFPYYYNVQYSIINPFCLIDKNFTRCEFLRDSLLIVRDFPFNIPKYRSFSLQIEGIPNPKYVTPAKFFIAIDDDQNYATVSEFAQITDVTPILGPVDKIIIKQFNSSQPYWIVKSEYTFVFTTLTTISGNTAILLDFSKDWVEAAAQASNITCLVNTVGAICEQIGFRILVTSYQTTFSPGSDNTLVIQGFRNPVHTRCIPLAVTLSIATSDLTTILARSYRPFNNVGSFRFGKNPGSEFIWTWNLFEPSPTDPTIITLQDLDGPLTLHRGTYSPILRLMVSNGKRANRNIQVSFIKSSNDLVNFVLYPENVMIKIGDYYVDIRVGVLRTVTSGFYPLFFQFDQEGGDFYDVPPSLQIFVDDTPLEILPPSLTQAFISISGFSLPIDLSMRNSPPYGKLTIESRIPIFPDLKLDFYSISDYNFDVEANTASVALRSDTTPSTNVRNTTLDFSVLPSDQPFFKLKVPSTQLTLKTDIATDLTWTASVSKTAATGVALIVRSSELCNVYWQVTLSRAGLIHNFRTSVSNYEQNFKYKFDDITQTQYGRFAVSQKEFDFQFVVANLLSNSTYQLTLWAENLAKTKSFPIEINFTTISNTDFLLQLQVNTDQPLSINQTSVVACEICKLFQYPIQRVRTPWEVSCDATVQSQYKSANEADPLNIQYNSTSSFYYLYPFEYMEIVQRPGILFEAATLQTNSTSDFQKSLKTILATYSINIIDFVYLGQVSVIQPAFASNGKISSTQTSILVQGVQLKNDGLVFGVLEKLNISIKHKVIYGDDPTFIQTRAGLNSSNLRAYGRAFGVYKEGSELRFEFTDLLPASYYRLVMYATSEDPSDYKYVSEIATIQTFTKHTIQLGYISLLLALSVIFIFIF